MYPTRSWFCKNVPGRPLQGGKRLPVHFRPLSRRLHCGNTRPGPVWGPVWPCAGCGDKAKDLYDTAKLEEKQNNQPHTTKLYRQIVEEYSDSPYANQAKTRLAELEKAR